MSTDLSYAVSHLELLAGRLRARGWEATITVAADRWPFVRVVNPRLRALNEDVMAAPCEGRWFYWFSWAERITELTDPSGATSRIEHVLSSESSEHA
jgi:hypothetical protein